MWYKLCTIVRVIYRCYPVLIFFIILKPYQGLRYDSENDLPLKLLRLTMYKDKVESIKTEGSGVLLWIPGKTNLVDIL